MEDKTSCFAAEKSFKKDFQLEVLKDQQGA